MHAIGPLSEFTEGEGFEFTCAILYFEVKILRSWRLVVVSRKSHADDSERELRISARAGHQGPYRSTFLPFDLSHKKPPLIHNRYDGPGRCGETAGLQPEAGNLLAGQCNH